MNKFTIEVKKDNKSLVANIKERSIKVLKSNDDDFTDKFLSLLKLIIKYEGRKSTEFTDDNRVRDKKSFVRLPYKHFKGYVIHQLRSLGYEVKQRQLDV